MGPPVPKKVTRPKRYNVRNLVMRYTPLGKRNSQRSLVFKYDKTYCRQFANFCCCRFCPNGDRGRGRVGEDASKWGRPTFVTWLAVAWSFTGTMQSVIYSAWQEAHVSKDWSRHHTLTNHVIPCSWWDSLGPLYGRWSLYGILFSTFSSTIKLPRRLSVPSFSCFFKGPVASIWSRMNKGVCTRVFRGVQY